MSKYKELIITSNFENRTNPITKKLEFHRGIDFRPINDEVYALISGKINKSMFGSYGEGFFVQIKAIINNVIFFTNNFHNEKNIKQLNEVVNKNDIIAKAGNTGNSTAKHIHLEIYTYNITNVKEIKKNVPNYFDIDSNRLFFHPLLLIKYFDENNIKY